MSDEDESGDEEIKAKMGSTLEITNEEDKL
jgi:hypothetical protein